MAGEPQPAVPQGGASKGLDEELRQQWDWNMRNHKPTPEAIRKIEGLRATAIALKDAIIAMAPHSRERSLALTNLEQVVFYSVAAVARTENEDTQPPADDTPEEDKALESEQQPKEKEGDK